MDKNYPKDGLYDLADKDIFIEAEKLYKDFFSQPTPITAFKLSIMLYHLLEWIEPGCNDRDYKLENLKAKVKEGLATQKENLILEMKSSHYYKILGSIANNSKHCKLNRSPSYEKGINPKFVLGKSAVGERLVQDNLFVKFEDEEVWLRDIFNFTIQKYKDYFSEKI